MVGSLRFEFVYLVVRNAVRIACRAGLHRRQLH